MALLCRRGLPWRQRLSAQRRPAADSARWCAGQCCAARDGSANWNGRSWHYSAYEEVCRGGSACQHSADLRLTVQDGAQGNAVRLETANAALLQKLGDSWQEALAEEHAWDLVEVLIPKSQLQH